MPSVLTKYLDLLFELFVYDVEVMSQPWMYYWVVPIVGYVLFFFFKWAVLTAPLWTPISVIIGVLKRRK